jgi:hypothetical protein
MSEWTKPEMAQSTFSAVVVAGCSCNCQGGAGAGSGVSSN